MKKEIQAIMDELKVLLVSQKTVLTVDDLATYTGLAKQSIYKLTSKHLLPFSCPQGKVIYFEKAKIDKWLLKNPIAPIDQVDRFTINHVMNNQPKGGKSWMV